MSTFAPKAMPSGSLADAEIINLAIEELGKISEMDKSNVLDSTLIGCRRPIRLLWELSSVPCHPRFCQRV
jgi:hypothetical protein